MRSNLILCIFFIDQILILSLNISMALITFFTRKAKITHLFSLLAQQSVVFSKSVFFHALFLSPNMGRSACCQMKTTIALLHFFASPPRLIRNSFPFFGRTAHSRDVFAHHHHHNFSRFWATCIDVGCDLLRFHACRATIAGNCAFALIWSNSANSPISFNSSNQQLSFELKKTKI